MHAITSPWRQCSNGEPSSRILCCGGCQAVEAFVSLKSKLEKLEVSLSVCVCWLFIFKVTEPSPVTVGSESKLMVCRRGFIQVSSFAVSRPQPLTVTVALTTAVRVWWLLGFGGGAWPLPVSCGYGQAKSGGAVLVAYALPFGPAAALGDSQLRTLHHSPCLVSVNPSSSPSCFE